MKKAAPYLLLVFIAIVVFLAKRFKKNNSAYAKHKTTTVNRASSGDVNRDRGFDRRISYLQYSNHAKCRMLCRHITQQEVEETMRHGKINYNKSDIQARCPRYAVEEVTNENQRVRIVFAQCNNSTEVVTVIDLETEWACDCPGDGDKYKNRN